MLLAAGCAAVLLLGLGTALLHVYFADGARCEIPGPRPDRLLEELLGYRRSAVARWQDNIRSALLVWCVGWGIPALGERMADAVPPSVDQAFGERALAGLDRSGILTPSTLDRRQQEALARLLREIAPRGMRVRLLLRGSDYIGLNAFALPDGTIVMTDLLGDFSGASGMSATLANLKFSRETETEADEFAIRLLRQHGISPLALADLLEWLERVEEDLRDDRSMSHWFSESGANFFETHPLTKERTARLRAAAQP